MDLSIIIVNWNSRDSLKKCLDSILAQAINLEFEVVVIDSGSLDGCGRMLSEVYPHVHFIQSPTNLGFARANNRAFQEATGNCTLFLNPDTQIVGQAINTLYENVNSLPNAGIVGPRLVNTDGSLQTSCIQAIPTIVNQLLDSEFLRTKWPKSRLWGMRPLYEVKTAASPVHAISGACLMISAEAFRKVGGFSEDYFMYTEDLDLSHKLQCAGYRNYYVPSAIVVHHGGNSSKNAPSSFATVMMAEATLRFFRKQHGIAYAIAYKYSMCAAALARIALLSIGKTLIASAASNASWHASLRKWQALLRWSLDQDSLVRKYYQAPPFPNKSGR